jgi:hypothetical protein
MSDTSTASTLETEPVIEPETETETDSDDPEQDDPVAVMEAVNECRNTYFAAYDQQEKQLGGPGKASKYLCEQHACKAYRNALPVLSSRQNILSFMACVAEGVLIEAINEKTGSKLIYAAQAAIGALPREPKPGRQSNTPPPPGVTQI